MSTECFLAAPPETQVLIEVAFDFIIDSLITHLPRSQLPIASDFLVLHSHQIWWSKSQ